MSSQPNIVYTLADDLGYGDVACLNRERGRIPTPNVIRGGLVSVTFRALSPKDVVAWVVRSGLEGIEWGGDVHVPHGDEARAREVAALTRDAGLCCCAYGSYYRLGVSEANGLAFERVLTCARLLDAPTIRIWAGPRGSADTEPALRASVVADGLRVAELAARENRVVALEYHAGTLTDTPESVAQLMRELNHPAVRFMWQPAADRTSESHGLELRQVLPRLANLHVFQWVRTGVAVARQPLAGGAAVWPRYLAAARETGRPHWALLEFVQGNDPEQFLRDAATLRDWLTPSESGEKATPF